MATLKDISAATGISVTQVSRALGGFSDVGAETRARVRAAADQLGYRPNALARALKSGRSGVVTLLMPEEVSPGTRAQLFETIHGLTQACASRGLRLALEVVPQTGAFDPEALFARGPVDGVIVLDPMERDPRIEALMAQRVPLVVRGRDPGQAHPCIDLDFAQIGWQLAQAACRAGHRRVLCLSGPETQYAARAFGQAVSEVMGEAGLAEGLHLAPSVASQARGRELALLWLARADRPTAIVAANAALAAGVYEAAAELDLAIPRDLSVLAHDDGRRDGDPSDASTFTPALTGTLAPRRAELDALANHLAAQIAGSEPSTRPQLLGAPFHEGGSLSAP
ncbi:transcriptional regulator [Thioclava dalianensis]|uniref:Transcriptional regulator n=1 Tax=Thioclava dalianensis TaxID=1185766 RepID=A0A074THG1_9RHOB|nr:LacI family DNA-binding transcriptional regulator [Thioclava dalianensis]KEP71099.1 transcriptional regulator [Thioclava dalianensis]SFN24877.1 LacI family transcriptional regulator [Thioclava dalianensis]